MNTPILMTDVMAAGGERVAVMSGYLSGSLRRDIENADRLTVVAPSDAPWTTHLRLGQVVRFPGRNGHAAIELRISQIQDGAGVDAGTVTITADPLVMDLARSIIRRTVEAGRTWFDWGLFRSTAANFVDTFLVPPAEQPVLHMDGMSWIERGTIDFDDRIDLSWPAWTALEMLHGVIDKLGRGELELENDDDQRYLINIREQRGADAPTLLLTLTRNLQALIRDRNALPLRTVMIPRGDIPQGDAEAASLGYSAFRVTDVSGNVLKLVDPSAGSDDTPVIAFDDQLRSPMHILRPDGSLTEILGSARATQTVEVVDATGIAEGDHVEIRADQYGTLLYSLDHPGAAQAPPDGFGRIMGRVDVPGGRGERNHVPNPFAIDWPGTGALAFDGTVDGSHVATATLNLRNLPPGLVIPAGSIVRRVDGSSMAGHIVVTGGTVNGSGQVALVMNANVSPGADGSIVYVYIAVDALPAGWSGEALLPVLKRDMSQAGGVVQGTLNGAISNSRRINISGLPPDTKLQIGDRVTLGVFTCPIQQGGVVDANGDVLVYTTQNVTSAGHGDPVDVEIQEMGGTEGGSSAIVLNAAVLGVDQLYVETAPYAVRHSDDIPLLCAHAKVVLWGGAVSSSLFTLPPRLEIVDADTDTVLAFAEDETPDESFYNRQVAFGSPLTLTLRAQYQLDQTRRIKLRIYQARVTGSGGFSAGSIVRWCMLTVGMDVNVPPTANSHGNQLWRAANAELLKVPAEPTTYRATMRDLSRMGVDLEREEIVLGGNARLIVPTLGIDSRLRIVAIADDLVDPLNTEITLARLTPRQTKQLAAARRGRQYVQVPRQEITIVVTDDGENPVTAQLFAAETLQTLPTSPTPPTDTEGSARGGPEAGEEETAPPTGAVPVLIWFRGGSRPFPG